MPLKEKAPPLMQKTILAVDDVAENLLTVKLILKSHYDICLAKSSDAAREVLERTNVDLILLDIEMPGKNGFDFLAEIQDVKEWKAIPVIFVTATATADFVNRAAAAGAIGYIVKPIIQEVLLSKVDDIFADAFMKQLAELEHLCATGRADGASALLDAVKEGYLYLPSTTEMSIALEDIGDSIKGSVDFSAGAEKIRAFMELIKSSR